RRRASPHARHFGHTAPCFQPFAGGELAVAQVFVDLDLAAAELSDEQVVLALAVDVGPTRAGIARRFDADRDAVGLEPDRWREVGRAARRGAADQTETCQQSLLHKCALLRATCRFEVTVPFSPSAGASASAPGFALLFEPGARATGET